MKNKVSLQKIYINYIFPIYVISNILTSTILAFAPEGGTNHFRMVLKMIRYAIYIVSIFYASSRWRVKKQGLIYALVISTVVLVSLVVNHNVQIICSMFVFWALTDYPWETIMKKHYQWLLTVLLVIVSLSQIGIIQDFIRNEKNRQRHFLGFNWATYAPIICFFIVVSFFCLKKGSVRLFQLVLFMALATILYILTVTRLAYLMTVLFILFVPVYNYLEKRKKYLKLLTSFTVFAPFLCAAVAIAIHALYNPGSPFFVKLNALLSHRLYFGYQGITNYGIKMIGQPIEWKGFDMTVWTFDDYNYIDCSYLHILLEYGVIFLLVFCILLTLGIRQAYKKNKYYLCWALCFICILGITETWLLNFTFNPFLWCGVSFFQGIKRQIPDPDKKYTLTTRNMSEKVVK